MKFKHIVVTFFVFRIWQHLPKPHIVIAMSKLILTIQKWKKFYTIWHTHVCVLKSHEFFLSEMQKGKVYQFCGSNKKCVPVYLLIYCVTDVTIYAVSAAVDFKLAFFMFLTIWLAFYTTKLQLFLEFESVEQKSDFTH